ncbi:MAG: hypothetical protein V1494_04515 [Candidatus Diapherotrites archaeon]
MPKKTPIGEYMKRRGNESFDFVALEARKNPKSVLAKVLPNRARQISKVSDAKKMRGILKEFETTGSFSLDSRRMWPSEILNQIAEVCYIRLGKELKARGDFSDATKKKYSPLLLESAKRRAKK